MTLRAQRQLRLVEISQAMSEFYTRFSHLQTLWDSAGVNRRIVTPKNAFEMAMMRASYRLGIRMLDQRRQNLRWWQQRHVLFYRHNNRCMTAHPFMRCRPQLFKAFHPYDNLFPRQYITQDFISPFSLEIGGRVEPIGHW